MRNSNITKMDSKGRILIPKHLRKFMKAENGTEIVLIPDNESTQVKLMPLIRSKTVEFKIVIDDVPGSLARIADLLSDYGVNIIMSESRTLSKKRLAEWNVITDISEINGNMENLKDDILKSGVVKKMEVVRYEK